MPRGTGEGKTLMHLLPPKGWEKVADRPDEGLFGGIAHH
jgi:hypothetical protein